mgnify:CR=1 FL=1
MFRIISIICVIITLVSANWVNDFDNSIYDQIHLRWQSEFCDFYFPAVTHLGDAEFYLSANLALFCFGDKKMKDSAKLSSVGLIGTMLTTQTLKCIVDRPRPEHTDYSCCKSSFPSGHTTAAFTLAYIYGAQYPKYRVPLYALAVSVALSRIYVGKHYPTDVIMGASIGTVGGIIVIHNKDFILSLGL